MCYTMLYMLELMRKRKYRIGIPRTWGLYGSTLLAYIHEWLYMQLYLRLLVQAGVGLSLLYYANMSNISLTTVLVEEFLK